ncbi:MAG: VWA domain-containing protein [bacterium]|nr:VWA domain-containing protein [bacterium]MCP5068474.1 VWA domain-containing protein [bacterium]
MAFRLRVIEIMLLAALAPPAASEADRLQVRSSAASEPGTLQVRSTTASEVGWLQVQSPAASEPTQSIALFEVAGRVGTRGGAGFDLVVAIDLSDSTLDPSGADLDGDGEGGVTDPAWLAALERRGNLPKRLTARLGSGLDLEDSILAAELEATAALIERLDPRRFRVGLIVFSDDAGWAAPLGSTPTALRRALEEIRVAAPEYLRGTNLAAAVALATDALAPEDAAPSVREQIIVLLTDGRPTLPLRDGPAVHAVRTAREAGKRGIRVHPFAVGPSALEAEGVLGEMASSSDGRLHRVESPAEVAALLRRLDLADLVSLEIRNLTSGVPARAVRTFPDGSFDGLVQLGEGMNRLRVQARRRDGREYVVERKVVLKAGSGELELQRKRLQALRRRTRELEIWAEIERKRKETRRALEIRVEEAPGSEQRY